jgi:hypothetical protein
MDRLVSSVKWTTPMLMLVIAAALGGCEAGLLAGSEDVRTCRSGSGRRCRTDAGTSAPVDAASPIDASPTIARDAGTDAPSLVALDAGARDSGARDSGLPDAGLRDSGPAPSLDSGPPSDPGAGGALPTGATGIAARYRGDIGIAGDPAVIFADDFESYSSASGLSARWNAGVYHHVRIATESGNVYRGARALEFTLPRGSTEISNAVVRTLSPGEDTIFFRYYSRFDPSFAITGSSHNGAGVSASYWDGAGSGPGIPADGYNKFLVEYECGDWESGDSVPSPGQLNVYVYHPEQRSEWGDHWYPDGTIAPFTYLPGDFGDDFVARPHFVPELGRWYGYELMVHANTPGASDGRIAFWVDGVLLADFQNVHLRDTAALLIDRFNLSFHAHASPNETRKWYDNVVVARSYIGPLSD